MKQRDPSPDRYATGWDHVRTILVPTDFSPRSDKALAYTLPLARQLGAEVHLLHVVGLHEDEDAHRDADARLAATRTRHDTEGVAVHPVNERGARPASALLDYAARAAVDLIVIGTHGAQGVRRVWLGSVSEEVVRRAPCHVLVVHERNTAETQPTAIQRILVPVDFSASSRRLVHQARKLAASYDAEIDLLHVIEAPSFLIPITGLATLGDLVPDLSGQTEACLERLRDEAGGPQVPIRTHLVEGHPASCIVRLAQERDIDLIVIATHGLGGMKRLFLGSVTERVVRAAPCPVLTVKIDASPPDADHLARRTG